MRVLWLLLACALGRVILRRALPWWLARLLGVSSPAADRLARTLERRVGEPSYTLRAGAFVVATGPAGRWISSSLRRRAVDATVHRMLEESDDTLVLLGLQARLDDWDCAGLLD